MGVYFASSQAQHAREEYIKSLLKDIDADDWESQMEQVKALAGAYIKGYQAAIDLWLGTLL